MATHITQTISQFPPAPDSEHDNPTDFNTKADAFVRHQSVSYVPEVNEWAVEANAVADEVNQGSTDAVNAAVSAASSKNAAADSETAAALSETNAKASETNAAASEVSALASKTAAATSEANAAVSETNAAHSETAATGAANFQGTWDVGTAYTTGQSVERYGNVYTAKVDNTGKDPVSNLAEWLLITQAPLSHPVFPEDQGKVWMANATGNQWGSNPGGFKNLIVNGDFSVWQEADSVYFNGDHAFVADVWYAASPVSFNLKKVKDGIEIDVVRDDSLYGMSMQSRIEAVDAKHLHGKKVTFSVRTGSFILNNPKSIAAFTALPTARDDWSAYSEDIIGTTHSLEPNTTYTWTFDLANNTENGIGIGFDLEVPNSMGDKILIEYAQLEVGDTATEFERVDYGTQLRRVQRYYEKGRVERAADHNGTKKGLYTFFYGANKRVIPTVTNQGDSNIVYFIREDNVQAIRSSGQGFEYQFRPTVDARL